MNNRVFKRLLDRYYRGECTPREKRFVEYWFGVVEQKPSVLETEPDWDEVGARMWQRMEIRRQEESDFDEIPSRSFWIWRWAGVAAAVVLFGWIFTTSLKSKDTDTTYAGWKEVRNDEEQLRNVRLEDGTLVSLSKGASLKYPGHFKKEGRDVVLEGRAFFDVHRDTLRPFLVHSGKIVTQVLGTSFYVEEGKGVAPRVEVVTGKVAVYSRPATDGHKVPKVVLKPNQKATFLTDRHTFETGLVDQPRLLNPETHGRFEFYNTPLSKVLASLNEAYGVDIRIENERLKRCTLTANISGKPFFTQLEIICAALRAGYARNGTTIFIRGKGC